MPETFLYLESDSSGLNAQVIEDSFKKQVTRDQCRILYKDLPEPEEGHTLFDTALSSLASQIRLDTCSSAVVLISSLKVSFRTLPFPFKSETKIKQILPLELSIHLPQADESYVSDFRVLKTSGRTGHYPVLTASVPESDIETIFTGLSRLGIRPSIIAPRGYASAIGFMAQQPQLNSFVFVDAGQHEVCITLVEDQYPVMVRTFQIHSFDSGVIGSELKKTIVGYSQRTGSTVKFDIFMSSANTDNDHTPVYQALSQAGENVFGTLNIFHPSENLPRLSPHREPRFLLNFCRGRFGKDSFFRKYARNISTTAAIGIVVLGILLFGVFKEIRALETKIAAVNAEIELIFMNTFPGVKNIGEPLLQMQSLVKQAQQKSGISSGHDQIAGKMTYSAGEVLYELSEKIPSTIDVDVSRLLLSNDRLTLSGSTDNFNTVDQIKSYLEASHIFKRVTIGSAAADKNGSRILFQFMIEL